MALISKFYAVYGEFIQSQKCCMVGGPQWLNVMKLVERASRVQWNECRANKMVLTVYFNIHTSIEPRVHNIIRRRGGGVSNQQCMAKPKSTLIHSDLTHTRIARSRVDLQALSKALEPINNPVICDHLLI